MHRKVGQVHVSEASQRIGGKIPARPGVETGSLSNVIGLPEADKIPEFCQKPPRLLPVRHGGESEMGP